MWVSAALALLAAGLLVWALAVASDRDSTEAEADSAQQQVAATQQELDSANQELDQAQQDLEQQESSDGPSGRGLVGAGGLAAAKAVYDDLREQLGTTEEDLAQAEQDLEDANARVEQAEKDAAAAGEKAEQAGDATEKAEAEADEAKADARAAESKAAIAGDCARAYVAALGVLLEGDDPRAQAPAVKRQLEAITSDCRAALEGT